MQFGKKFTTAIWVQILNLCFKTNNQLLWKAKRLSEGEVLVGGVDCSNRNNCHSGACGHGSCAAFQKHKGNDAAQRKNQSPCLQNGQG